MKKSQFVRTGVTVTTNEIINTYFYRDNSISYYNTKNSPSQKDKTLKEIT